MIHSDALEAGPIGIKLRMVEFSERSPQKGVTMKCSSGIQ
jgi:hypothetical protein